MKTSGTPRLLRTGAVLLTSGLAALTPWLAGRAGSEPLLIAQSSPEPAAPVWLASEGVYRLIVQGSLLGLAAATLTIVLIWLHEWRNGKVW
ncbi:hypothetical protein EVJ50_06195 [Synechococcus sp. RSCCF101]|uniref:hypothetical protein n=1 Tax=Synechococcus sp. RSCCF101 TaxID=2511069 RepID=UPI001247A4CA|nr:hypothetical protein [Synechococcus sp. RSCCF101]QEY31892.1 hypothetical protein EVJ50_06195 [Synechococcus sp. RSCCF101]